MRLPRREPLHEGNGEEQIAGTETLLGLNREEWGWTLLGLGAAGALGSLLRRGRSPVELLLPLGLVGGGVALLLREREQGIDRAQERIAAELDTLDPIARAQVLKRVASEKLALRRRDKADEASK